MQRRSFLQIVLGLSAAGLAGCGDSEDASFVVTGTGAGPALPGTEVTGRIDSELGLSDGVVGSAFGPTEVSRTSFATRISAEGVGLLVLQDRDSNVRGFALTFPGETPVISFESTIFAAVSMEPGFLHLQTGPARDQIAAVRSTSGFSLLLAYLRANAGTALDFPSGEPEFQEHLNGIIASLGNPLLEGLALPTATAVGQTVTLRNPSRRFLSVSRDGQALPELLPPFGTLVDVAPAGESPDYSVNGFGTLENGDPEDSLVNRTFPPTVQIGLLLPLYELAAGQRIALANAVDYFQTVAPSYPSIGSAAHDEVLLAASLQTAYLGNVDDIAKNVTSSFESLDKLISASRYLEGLAFSIASILKFKQHKDNPTQIPLGAPTSMVFVAAALLFLPALLGITGSTLFGDNGAPTASPSRLGPLRRSATP